MSGNVIGGSDDIAEPTCPQCSIKGIQHIVSRPSVERSRAQEPWFFVVFCSDCGHVYNVLAKHVVSQRTAPRFVLPKN